MSQRSDRKWAAKDQRAAEVRDDARRDPTEGNGGATRQLNPSNTEGGNGYLSRALQADRLSEKAKTSGSAADHETAAQAHVYAAAGASMSKDWDHSTKLANQHAVAARDANKTTAEKLEHRATGETHLVLAAGHKEAAKSLSRTLGRVPETQKGVVSGLNSLKTSIAHHEEKAAGHLASAAEHASSAGGEWDEGKHPRDENGKFA
jgi:hypothetical protein